MPLLPAATTKTTPAATAFVIAVSIAALEHSRRRSDRGALLIIDADHFKAINDSYGHLTGDEALLLIAAAIKDGVRAGDILGRIGGEEFLIVLPGCDELCALSHAERVRQVIERTPVVLDGVEVHVTASFGASSMQPNSGFSPELLVRAADEGLYTAKRQGRNRVSFQLPEKLGQTRKPLT